MKILPFLLILCFFILELIKYELGIRRVFKRMLKRKILKALSVSFAVLFMNMSYADLLKSEYKVKSGDNLISILNKNYVNKNDIHKLVYETKDSKNLQKLKIGQEITVYKDNNGYLKKLILEIDPVNLYVAEKTNSSFKIKKGRYKTNVVNQYVMGSVTYSVNGTLKEMGLSKSQRKNFIEMFGDQVDFKKLKKGTLLTAVFPEHYKGKAKVKTDDLVSAEVSYKGKKTTVYGFNNYKGEMSYYLSNGQPTNEGIDRVPVESYSRISSHYSPARKHPVLGRIRAHNGTDYAAKRNTPIYAAASGKIALKDVQKHGYGNVIVIDHKDGYSTLYAHMNKFEKGVYSGKRVEKGDLIGYVGSTGISTGNHLHFEIRKDGKYLDPQKVKLPAGYKISKSKVNEFRDFVKKHSEGIKIARMINKKENKTRVAIRK